VEESKHMSIHFAESEFKKSSFCVTNNCVEVGLELSVLVWDGKSPDAAPHKYTVQEWEAFESGVRNGEFQLSTLLAQLRCD
jgi:hypothetical protein